MQNGQVTLEYFSMQHHLNPSSNDAQQLHFYSGLSPLDSSTKQQATWGMSIEIFSSLDRASILAYSIDLKRIEASHSLFCDFRGILYSVILEGMESLKIAGQALTSSTGQETPCVCACLSD